MMMAGLRSADLCVNLGSGSGPLVAWARRRTSFAPRIYKIGVTGGMASGKSTLLRLLRDTGKSIDLLDCDRLGHSTYVPGSPIYTKLLEMFGSSILLPTSEIHRPTLAKLVFQDPHSMTAFNGLVWPAIVQSLRKKILCSESRGMGIIVIEGAMLFEAGVDALTDEIWALGVPEEEAVRRAVKRGFTVEQAEERIHAQLDVESRKRMSDLFIDSYHIPREENAVRILARLGEIEQMVQERRAQHEHWKEGEPLPCDPVLCKCPYEKDWKA
uniref:Dephospho-CoA kinase n=1 Tax=Arcella intermedia TaxID=1963864 RepID=A0A6B2LD12_9EUKA